MALVLCVGIDAALMQTRRLILEAAGHNVIGVHNERELVDECQAQNFDLAVISQTISADLKLRFFALVRQHAPKAKILELYSPYSGPCLLHAEDWLCVPLDIPADLALRVSEMTDQVQGQKSRIDGAELR